MLLPRQVLLRHRRVRWILGQAALVSAAIFCYFQVRGLGDALVAANGWDVDDLARYRSHPTLVALGDQQADKALSRAELVEVSRSLPGHWLPSSSASGTSVQCATRLRAYMDAGADELVLHGSSAEHLGAVASAFSAA